MRRVEGPAIVPALRDAGFDPASVDIVAMSHLHFDHAGGLLLAGRVEGVPAGARSSPSGPSGRSRWATTRGSSPRTTSRSSAWSATGARRAGPRASGSCCPASPWCRPAAIRPVTRPWSSAAPGARAARVLRRPVDAAVGREPRWVTSFDDFPLTSVEVKATLFAQAADEGWTVVLSHESRQPVGPPGPRPRPLPLRGGVT